MKNNEKKKILISGSHIPNPIPVQSESINKIISKKIKTTKSDINEINIIKSNNKINEISKILEINNSIQVNLDNVDNINNSEQVIIKKKKGRKSKKNKLLELELEAKKEKESIIKFPPRSEKIFDVVLIDEVEYFYDTDFNILLDIDSKPVGFKNNNKFIFYSEKNKEVNQEDKEENKVNKIKKILEDIMKI